MNDKPIMTEQMFNHGMIARPGVCYVCDAVRSRLSDYDALKAELAAARPLLEAARKIDKELAIKTLRRLYHPIFQEKGRPMSVPIFDSIMPLLEAIPDGLRVVEQSAAKEEK